MNDTPTTIRSQLIDDWASTLVCGKEVPDNWWSIDWWSLANRRAPLVKLTFDEGSVDDWLLFRKIEALAACIDVKFPNAAHWVIRRALGDCFQSARDMDAKLIPWIPEIQYVCRIVSLQFCKYHKPDDIHTLGLVDHMIYLLLIPDDEMLLLMQAVNHLPC